MTKCGDPGCDYCGADRLEYSAREYDRVVAERDRLLKATSPIHAHVDALRAERDRLLAERDMRPSEYRDHYREKYDRLRAALELIAAGQTATDANLIAKEALEGDR